MKELLPIGSVVMLKGATKKLMITGILQVNPAEKKMYDYLGVPYPEGYVSADRNFLFNHEDIWEIAFHGYSEREWNDYAAAVGEIADSVEAEFSHG